MRSWKLDGSIQLLGLVVAVVVCSGTAHGQGSISVESVHQGDTSHLEFKGRDSWIYELKRKAEGSKDVITILVPPLDQKSQTELKTWTSPLVEQVLIDVNAADQKHQLTFVLKNKTVQSFDYQTDQPSRLIVDFFNQAPAPIAPAPVKPAQKVAAVPAPTAVFGANSKSRILKVRGDGSEEQRKPSSADFMVEDLGDEAETSIGPEFTKGIFDGADPNFERFRVKDYEIKESALIASQQNIYLRFPLLKLEKKPLTNILNNPPLYEIDEGTTDEHNEARLLQTLFERKRPAVFNKTLAFFEKKYPDSKYRELLRYMAADILLEKYRESGKPDDFEAAMSAYQTMLAKYPESPLYERTALLVGYSYLDRGDYMNALREFQRFSNSRPLSEFNDAAKIALAEAFTGLNKFDEAVAILQDVAENSKKAKYLIEATFRLGDVAAQKKDYPAALVSYKQALKTYPQGWMLYPNAYFNSAEALFWTGEYQESLNTFREYLRRFASPVYGGYSMTRVAEIMEILGVDQRRVMGAFLESYYRYGTTPGGKIARIRLISQRLKNMKPKEMEKSLEEANQITKESDLLEMPEFVTITIADGLYRRGEYDSAINRLVHFYQSNPSSKNLGLIQNRIVRSITEKIRSSVDTGDFLSVLRTYSKYSDTWLKSADRIDVRYYLGRAFEQAGVFKEAGRVYRETLNRIYSLVGTPLEKERNVFELLPSHDTLNLRLAAVELNEGNLPVSLDFLQQIKGDGKLNEVERVEKVEIAAEIAEKTGRTRDAARSLSTLVDTWNGQPQRVASPLVKLAQIQSQQGEFDQAQAALKRVLNLQADTQLVGEDLHAKALELQGDVYLKTKKNDEAVKSYNQLLDLYEKKRPLASVRYRLGEIEFKRGNVKEAEKVWQPLSQSSNKVWAQMAQEQLRQEQFQDDYKKYLNRIPAMADLKAGAK